METGALVRVFVGAVPPRSGRACRAAVIVHDAGTALDAVDLVCIKDAGMILHGHDCRRHGLGERIELVAILAGLAVRLLEPRAHLGGEPRLLLVPLRLVGGRAAHLGDPVEALAKIVPILAPMSRYAHECSWICCLTCFRSARLLR
jgi:hypothetical protein